MKRMAIICLLGLVVCVGMAGAGEEKAWFDMEGCAFCKHLMEDPGLIDNVTRESHEIENGIVMISTVTPEKQEAYDRAEAAIQELGAKLMSEEVAPEDLSMCNHCKYYGMLMQAGAKIQKVDGEAADVQLITSDNPEVIAKIKKYGEKNQVAMEKWEAEHHAE